MIDFYLASSLLGIGYIFNKYNQEQEKTVNLKKLPKGMLPSKNNFIPKVKKIEKELVQKNISDVKTDTFRSEILGIDIPTDRAHNNMVPFFSGNSTGQNIDPNANIGILENFGVNNDSYFPKREMEPLFSPEPTLPINSRRNLDSMYERAYTSKIQNNVLPFEQVKVGPGIGKDYKASPSGGFQQDSRDFIINDIPTVDTLRAKNNPKNTYKGRIIQGIKDKKRPAEINMTTNEQKVLVKERTNDDFFKTTGAFLKEKKHAAPIVKDTNRKVSKAYAGNAYSAQATVVRSKTQEPLKTTFGSLPTGIASLVSQKNNAKDDYGQSSIQIYANERDITSTKVYQGNVTSMIKAIVAPIQDIIKHSKKEYYVEHSREFGNMNVQIPNKQTVKDPNDVARTTIKEQFADHPREFGNVSMPIPSKQTVKDPNDVARTTIKETTIHNDQKLNLKGRAFKSIAYDPNSIARTTIKETTLHDTQPANVRVFEKRNEARIENDATKPTIRETLENIDNNVNINPPVYKATVYDPDDIARTTVKETTLYEPPLGIVDHFENNNAAYTNLNMEAKMTMKETYSDTEYYGIADKSSTDAYKNIEVEAKTTLRENSEEYFGIASETNAKKPTDYKYIIENAETNELRSLTDHNREPTHEGVKVANGADSINVDIKKIEEDTKHIEFKTRIVNQLNDKCDSKVTKLPQEYMSDDRLDREILEPYRKNPYTQPLPNS